MASREIYIHGKRVYFNEYGDGQEVMLLLHGWGGSANNFSKWVPVLSRKYRLIIPDLPGCGKSESLSSAHTVEAYAKFLEDFVNQLGIKELVIGGLFVGAILALEFTKRNEDRVRGLLLHNPPYAPNTVSRVCRLQTRIGAYRIVRFAVRKSWKKAPYLASIYKKIMNDGFSMSKADQKMNLHNLKQADYDACIEFLQDCLKKDYTDLIRQLSVPINVLIAINDRLIRYYDMARILELTKNVSIALLPGGHAWSDEFVEIQNRALEDIFVLNSPN